MQLKWLSLLWKNKKYIGYVSAILGVIIAIWQLSSMLYDSIYERGRADMRQELTQQMTDRIGEMRKKYEEQTQKALDIMASDYEAEISRIKAEQEVIVKTEKVIEYVDREIEVPVECESTADDIIWVLQQGIHTIRSTRDGSPESGNQQ